MPNPRLSRKRTRRAASLTAAGRWWLTGELDPQANQFEMQALYNGLGWGAPLKQMRELLERFGHLVPDSRRPMLETMARGERIDRPSLLDRDIVDYWELHGFVYPKDDSGIGDIVGEVDGVSVRRPGIPSQWFRSWAHKHKSNRRAG